MKRDIKIHIIRMRLLEGYKDKQIIDEIGVSRRTYFYWKKNVINNNTEKLLNKSKPGPKPTMNIDPIISGTLFDSRMIRLTTILRN